ncbi:hypothetical protein VTO42DRAFT_7505 [Malbranchea cinnamomea]
MSASDPVVLRGGCLCKKIRFMSTSYPEHMSNCLCVQCRKSAGGPFQTYARFPRSAIAWVTEPPKYFRSSDWARRGFCDTCGSSLTFEMDKRPEWISIAPSSIDCWEIPEEERHKLGKPVFYVFARERAVWFDAPADRLPRWLGDDEDEAAELENASDLL